MPEKFKENLGDKKVVSFEEKKRDFFVKIGLRAREALEAHKDKSAGDMWGKKKTAEDWRNVSEHCLVEAARAEVFAEKLGFSEQVKRDLITAAVLHDFYKKHEIEKATREGLGPKNHMRATEEAAKILHKKGFSDRVVRLSGSMALDSLMETEEILKKENLSEEDAAFLVLHFIDDYSSGSDWVEQGVDSLDARINNLEANPKYKLLKASFKSQRRIGHLVEKRLSDLITKKGTMAIADSVDLPYMVDQEIRAKIESESL